MTSPHEILGIKPDASSDEIKQAYRKLAKQYHPDLNRHKGDAIRENDSKFKEIAAAYEALTKPTASDHTQNGAGFSDPFQDFSRFVHININDLYQGTSGRKNLDHSVRVGITLEDAFRGKDASLIINHAGVNHTLQISIPAGSQTGHALKIPQAGDRSNPAFKPGDLYVHIIVADHPNFVLRDTHLVTKKTIGALDLLIGGVFEILTIEGTTLNFTIPAGHNPKAKLRIPGHGFPNLTSGLRGDLLIELDVEYSPLSSAQLELIKQARDLGSV